MTDNNADILLNAIKKDDAELFGRLANGNSQVLSYCYGKFPILSLCYLYKSKKIIKKHSEALKDNTKYIFLEEDNESYRKFKGLAKKSLSIYVYKSKIVSPLEMLAILDEKLLLEEEFANSRKSQQEREHIETIYNVVHERVASADDSKLKISRKKRLSLFQCILIATIICFSTVIIACSGMATGYLSNNFGTGTITSPLKITGGAQFPLFFKEGSKNYILENDITLTESYDKLNISGTLDGNGKTVHINGTISNSLFNKITGTIKNINFVFENYNFGSTENISLLANENKGTIENVNIKVVGNNTSSANNNLSFSSLIGTNNGVVRGANLEFENLDINLSNNTVCVSLLTGVNKGTIENINIKAVGKTANSAPSESGKYNYFSCLFGENYGTIREVTLNADISSQNDSNGDTFLLGLGCLNNGTIENCIITDSSRLIGKTVDISAVVKENASAGVIRGCTNNGYLFQENTLPSWSPNVCGFALNNIGTIENCKNNGKIDVSLNVPIDAVQNPDTRGAIYASGIAIENTGKILASENNASITLTAKGAVILAAGGIVTINIGTVTNCLNTAEIKATSNDILATSILIGGICGQNNYILSKNKNTGTITASTLSEDKDSYAIFAGGITGYSGKYTDTLIDNCISECNINITSPSNAYVFGGGISGRVESGLVKNCISDTKIKANAPIALQNGKLHLGGVAGFYLSIPLINKSENNYFVSYAGQTFGIGTEVTVKEDKYVFGAPINIGTSAVAKDKIKELEVYW